jgi:hypothetical protein
LNLSTTQSLKNMPKVELKNVKYFPSMSEETPCFQAAVYIDGERIGEASNRGFGGMTDVRPHGAEQDVDKIAKARGLKGADDLIDNLFAAWEIKTELTKLLKKRVVFINADGEVAMTKPYPAATLAEILKRPNLKALLNTTTVFNLLTFDEALKVYTEQTTTPMATN